MSAGLQESPLLRLELEPPNEALQEKARLELRETPANIENGLKELKALLQAEKDLTEYNLNDEWLWTFLRSCKFYPESARDLIKRFYQLRHKYPEINSLLLPGKLKHVFDANLVSILPQRDQHGRRMVVVVSGGDWDYRIITQDELLAGSVLCTDLIHYEPASQINGIVYLVDFKGLTFDRALRCTPYVTKRILDFSQYGNPMRVKGFHIVNQPRIFQPIFAAVKRFFSPKFSQRCFMHGTNYESLHRYISPECLPKCYGGTLDIQLMHSRATHQLLDQCADKFEELQKYGVKKQK